MRGRDYNKRIYINEYTSTPDGFGGNIASVNALGGAWAKLVNRSSQVNQRVTSLGLTELNDPLIFHVRYTDVINNRATSLTYLNNEYVIQSIVDVDQMHRELEIVCTKSTEKHITPPKDNTFDYTFNFRLA